MNPPDGVFSVKHNHPDKNSITLSAYGQDFIVDLGYGCPRPEDQNYILIDGRGQSPAAFSGGVNEGRIARYHSSNTFDFIHADAKEAFDTYYYHGLNGTPVPVVDPTNSVLSADRFVLSQRSSSGSRHYFVVADDINRDNSQHQYSWTFNTKYGTSGSNPIVISSGGKMLKLWHQQVGTTNFSAISKSQPGNSNSPILGGSQFVENAITSTSVNPFFHYVLLPYNAGDQDPATVANPLVNNGSCFKFVWPGYEDYSVFKHASSVSSAFVSTDGKLTQIRKSISSGLPMTFAMAEGSLLTFDSRQLIDLYGQQGTVMMDANEVSLFGNITGYRVYAPSANTVRLNGNPISFVRDGDYVDGTLQLVSENKSLDAGATFSNSARHIAQKNGYLHEAFTSGGQIYYRRQNTSTSLWDVTKRVSDISLPDNGASSIFVDHSNAVHIVWQRSLSSTVLQVCYARSNDGGVTWSTPIVLPGCSSVSTSQYSLFPVIAEWNSQRLVVVFCSSDGLKYTTSDNGGVSWSQSLSSIHSNIGADAYVWYPSLTTVGNYLSLTYDYRYYGVWSRRYDGSWSSESSVNDGTGTIYDRYSSVSDNGSSVPVAAWSAQRYGDYDWRIIYREGTSNNTWGWWTEFDWAPPGISDMYPSVTALDWGWNAWYPAILHQSTTGGVAYKQYNPTYDYWDDCALTWTGAWANLSVPSGPQVSPVAMWTDQSASPHQINLYSGYCGMSRMNATTSFDKHRKVVLKQKTNKSSLAFEMSPLQIITTNGDTVTIPFKAHRLDEPINIDFTSVWDYLGTDAIALPGNANRLILEAAITSQADIDTTGRRGPDNFSSRSFAVQLEKGNQKPVLWSNKNGTSGKTVVDVRQFAGQTVRIRPSGTIPVGLMNQISVSVGDVYVTAGGTPSHNALAKTSEQKPLPTAFALTGSYPNPFNPSTTISYELPEPSHVSLAIYDMLGRKVAELANGMKEAGYQTATWNASGVSSGMYSARFTATDGSGNVKLSKIHKLLLTK